MATLIAGGPIRGSWWAHPKSHQIFAQASALGRDPDVIVVPLVAGKVAFVHRRLWPALLAVALERDRWQTTGLSSSARALLKRVAKVHEVHTETGGHAKVLDAVSSKKRSGRCRPPRFAVPCRGRPPRMTRPPDPSP